MTSFFLFLSIFSQKFWKPISSKTSSEIKKSTSNCQSGTFCAWLYTLTSPSLPLRFYNDKGLRNMSFSQSPHHVCLVISFKKHTGKGLLVNFALCNTMYLELGRL